MRDREDPTLESGNRTLAEALAMLDQLCSNISDAVPLDQISRSAVRAHTTAPQIEEWLTSIWRWDRVLQEHLDHAAFRDPVPIQNAPERLARFFQERYEPNRRRLLDVFYDCLFGIETETDAPQRTQGDEEIAVETRVRDTMEAALDVYARKLESEDFDESVPDDTELAAMVVRSDVFDPDLWIARRRAIQPLLSRRPPQNFPANVRIRLAEAYSSFAFGNRFAALAVSRALLEYALLDRARQLGFEPREQVDGRMRDRDLQDLCDQTSSARPDLREDLGLVRRLGNYSMHPRKDPTIAEFPRLLERDVINCLRAIRRILFELYS